MAAGNGLVSLGIVALMRGGVVPFGQGMVFAAGGYAAALALQQARLHRRARPGARRRRRRGARRRAVRAAAVALPRHLLRDADAGPVDGDLRPADEARGPRRLRRLQRRPADAARPEAARRPRRLRPLPADHLRRDACRAGDANLLRQHARPGDARGARQRAARRVPRRLGASGDGDQLRRRRVLRRPRRRAGRPLARPHRARTSATGRPRASSSSSPSSPAGRASPRCSSPAPCSRSCARSRAPTSRTPGSSRSACSCCS